MTYVLIAIAVLIASYSVYRSLKEKAKAVVASVTADVKADIDKIVTDIKDKL